MIIAFAMRDYNNPQAIILEIAELVWLAYSTVDRRLRYQTQLSYTIAIPRFKLRLCIQRRLLLMPQGFDRIHLSRPDCGIDTKNQPHR